MATLAIVLQVVLALGIVNVWIIRRDRATAFRPEGARNIAEEFQRYGFPDWVRQVVGTTKLLLAVALLAGIWFTSVAPFAAGLLAVLMAGAIAAHIRVRDAWTKSVPAFGMLTMSVLVLVAYTM